MTGLAPSLRDAKVGIGLNGRDYSMGISTASGSFQGARSLPPAWERRHPCLRATEASRQGCLRSQARYRSRRRSFARGLPRGDWRDREGVKVAPEQLDEARFAEFDLAAWEDARPSGRGRCGQFIAGAGLHRRAVVGVLRVDLVDRKSTRLNSSHLGIS